MRKDILKVVLIGDGGVGKTAIRVQYIHKRFTSNYKATIGADFITKDVQLEDGKKVSMQIWDTAGQERFQSLGIAYYRGADACIIVFDVTNPNSFNNVLNWEHEFIDKADLKDPSTYPFVLIGNKTDMEEERVISKSQGRRMAIKMREQSIKEAPHYGIIQQQQQQNKYSPNDNSLQSYNDSLLAIYQRSASYKRYNHALQKETTNKNNNQPSTSNTSYPQNNSLKNPPSSSTNINYTNKNVINSENIEGITSYSIAKNKRSQQNYNSYNTSTNPLFQEDEESINYEDYDDLENYRIPYFEVSAKSGSNIEAAFNHIAKTVQLPQFEFLIEGDTINWDDDYDDRHKNLNKCCF